MGQTLWFTSRAGGMVALLLLTLTVVLGALHTGRAASAAGRSPRSPARPRRSSR